MTHFADTELDLIQIKDLLFGKFCSFLNDEVRKGIRLKHRSLFSQTFNLSLDNMTPSVEETCVLGALEEQWANFLAKLDEGEIEWHNAEDEYYVLIDRMRTELEKHLREDFTLIKNPYHYITWANDIVINEWAFYGDSGIVKQTVCGNDQKVKLALKLFEKAIQLDEPESDKDDKKSSETAFTAGPAHMGVAWCLTLLKTDEDYKDKALKSLKTALQCMSNEMTALNATQLLLRQRQKKKFANSDLDKQLVLKSTILGSYIRSIDSCKDSVLRSKRLVDVVEYKNKNGVERRKTLR